MKKIIYILFLVICSLSFVTCIHAQSCDPTCSNVDECNAKKIKCEEAWNSMEKAKKPHVDALKKMESDIQTFQKRIQNIEAELVKKAKAILTGEKELEEVLNLAGVRIRQFYIRSSTNVPMLALLSSTNVGSALREYAYQQAVTSEDKKVITQTALLVKDLEDRKIKLEKENATLSSMKVDLDKRAESVRKLVGDANAYQTKLSSIIASLTAQQQSFLAAKLAGLNLPTSLGAGPLFCTDDRKLNPGFSPAFAFFTFGIPHRVGLNQYGALGRAKQGKTYREILDAYFTNFSIEKREGIRIKVQGYGEMGLEDYLLGIYEMPGDWPLDALKAQVVAARSYALSYTNNGQNEICTTQACQVYKGGNKGGNWESAVRSTTGEVMISGGEIVKGWYSSTDGGYTFTSGDVWGSNKSWTRRLRDANGDIGSFSDLMNKAYDKDSPCFYAAQGYRNEYAKSAWLKSEEVADIANVILLVRKDSANACFVYQPDRSPPPPNPKEGCPQTGNWSESKVKQELGSGAFNAVNSISIEANFGSGETTKVIISGDAGTKEFDGKEFKNYFNLRAPSNIQIVGPLFNVERK